ncbi:MAG: hypothetical protein HY515_02020 [Candidatus Aenigmarchaeota archaeon]|nr:hypothetical protein [Candidatus Aenigmarchaeota archaeon]
MGLVRKGDNEQQRKRMAKMSMRDQMMERAAQERQAPTRDEIKCHSCGFKAHYQFIRCPECNEVQ